MEQMDDKKLIAEMNEFLANDAQTCADAAADPEDGLPFESIDSYSTDPIGFENMSLKMLNKVEAVFDLAVLYNRHSSKYLKKCAQLEKGIKYLGTLCYTKHALERKEQTFPSLGQLSTEKLYCMASFHFEKLDRALTEYIEQKHEIDDSLLDMQFRYFSLLDRIRSTEVKLHKYDDCLYYGQENYDPVINGFAFSEKSWTKSCHDKEHEAPAFRHSPAFPLPAEVKIMGAADKPRLPQENKGFWEQDSVDKDSHVSSVNPDPENKVEKGFGIQDSGVGDSYPEDKNAETKPEQISEARAEDEVKEMHREQFSKAESHRTVSEQMQHDGKPEAEEISEISAQNKAQEVSSDTANEPAQQNETLAAPLDTEQILSEVYSPEPGFVPESTRITEQGNRIAELSGEVINPLIPGSLPMYIEVMRNVIKRSETKEDDELCFTFDELEFLAADPEFNYYEPALAADIRKALSRLDTG